ncbi:tagaturonate reductase [Algoriphagus sp. AK58]|uniref:tagaturonate reductase n=1 Tax=Algoriphagus sp. AK58 TaxID=1406877 RepID=UPI00164F6036|nr:tagaturonate reductase [Algoriphagus sp. AK58]MBC6366059.1 hypothetical protein [Algoriphagus sp. AK58]
MKNNSIQILQFGTGNFLRAFIEPMVQDLIEKDIHLNICMIQSTGGKTLENLKKQNFEYHVLTAGLENGEKVEQIRKITCIKDGLILPDDSDKFFSFASIPEVKWIISNVTEAGMIWKTEGNFQEFAESFAGRLTQWLFRRFESLPEAETVILPCELLPENGNILKSYVLKHAENWNQSRDFSDWINRKCRFFNSLVDRIVPGFPHHLNLKEKETDSFIVQTEPYCFWAIEGNEEDRKYLPFLGSKAEVLLTETIDFYSLRKIRILNGLHTFMTGKGLLKGFETVGEYVNQPENLEELHSLLETEIFPTLHAPVEELRKYAAQVIDRFRNPFVSHKLADISLNSTAKFKSRLAPIFHAYLEKNKTLPPIATRGLVGLILFYLRFPEKVKDTQEVTDFYSSIPKELSEAYQVIFASSKLFGLTDHQVIQKACQDLLPKRD